MPHTVLVHHGGTSQHLRYFPKIVSAEEEVRTLTGQEKSLETAVTDAATSPAVSWEMGSQDADQADDVLCPNILPHTRRAFICFCVLYGHN